MAAPRSLRLFGPLRPVELYMLAFAAVVALIGGRRALVALPELIDDQSVAIAFALALVAAISLWRELRSQPWPEELERLSRVHARLLPLALTPFALALGLALTTPGFVRGVASAPIGLDLLELSTLLARLVGFGLPTLLLWLVAGVELRSRGALEPGLLLRWTRRGLSAAREWLPLSYAIAAYMWMTSVQSYVLADRDGLMHRADLWLFAGHDPVALVQPLISVPLTEWLEFSYCFYAAMFLLVPVAALQFGGRAALREVSFAVSSALLTAYVIYYLVPVKGPMLTQVYDVPLKSYLIGDLKQAIMDLPRTPGDCFPSMHACASALLAWSAWRHARRLFWFMLPMVVSIPLACVYLRYHYVVDLVAGYALAGVTVALTVALSSTFAESPAVAELSRADAH